MASPRSQIDTYTDKSKDESPSFLDLQFQAPIPIPKEVDQTQNLVCTNNAKTDINNDLLSLYVDDKIKPYEVFIRMMTNDSALGKAQGEHM